MRNMTSHAECVETVEAEWKIPNFLFRSSIKYPEDHIMKDFSKEFFVGGRVPTADPQGNIGCQQSPFLIEVWKVTSSTWYLRFIGLDLSGLPSSSPFRAKILELKTLLDLSRVQRKPMDFRETAVHDIRLFDQTEAEHHLDKDDGSLNIQFKLEVTFCIPDTNTPNILTGGCSQLLNDFEALLNDSSNSDVEIKVSLGRGHTFQCHKGILAARSDVFRAMFSSGMKESTQNVVEIEDILPKTMEHLISFLYCGRFQDSSWIVSVPQLVYAADKYCVESLKDVCDIYLIQCVTFRNALAMGKLAERHGLIKAAKKIREFLAENAEIITLDTEVETSDANFRLCYRIP